MYRWSISLIFAAAALPQLFGQDQVGRMRDPAFKTNPTLVLAPVTVVDRRGAIVNGLRPNAFRIFEDKTPQEIFSFTEQDVPASIGVVLDTSASMKGTLDQAQLALRSFLDTANPEDEAFAYTVSSRPNRNSGFTENLEALSSGLLFAEATGSTALIDTIYCGLSEMRSAHRARRALLIISDGMDNHSRYTKNELMELALEANVQIYTIWIYNPPAYEKPIQLHEERQGLFLLEDLTMRTGGLNFVVRNAEDIAQAAATTSRAIRNQYTIGYVPQNASHDGKWHSIRVKLSLQGVKAYTRSGYHSQ
jgi:Ca-activated chloride channel family protein